MTFLSFAISVLSACSNPSLETTPAQSDVTGLGETSGVCSASPKALNTQRLSVKGTSFRDEWGRHVILRGVNTGGRSKFAPFFPFPFAESGLANQEGAVPFSEAVAEYLDRVVDWGHNIIRVPFSWEGLEPVRGVYDDVYLERFLAFIDAAAARELRVVVDFHQDVFAAPYCGDGFPLWACPEPLPAVPEDCSGWFMGYLEQASPIHEAYGRFWRNEDGLMDAFKAMWKHMATAASTRDNVIGFEIINEPHHGTQDEDAWATTELPTFYEELSAEIRSVAPDALIFFDSTGLDAATQETLMERPEGSEFIFAPHYYLMSIYTGGELDMEEVPKGLARWRSKGVEWNLPILVGEFGIYRDLPEAREYFRVIMDSLDTELLSGTAWEFSTTVDDWNDEGMSLVHPTGDESDGLQALIRPYPAAVAGEIESFHFDSETREANLIFDAEAGGLTEVVLPQRLYTAGVAIVIDSDDACYEHREDDSRLFIRVRNEGRVQVSLKPQ